MTQFITTRYQEFDTSEVQNRRFVNVIKPGVYNGYVLSVNPGVFNLIDITTGLDPNSTLVTNEGVIVTETADLPGAVRIASSDPAFDRIDLVVAEYQYSTNNSIEQTYKVIRGTNQVDVGLAPVKPSPQNEFQVPLGFVYVRSGTTSITKVDVEPVAKASNVSADTWTNLQPIRFAEDTTILYVFPGTFPNADGTRILSYPGGYTTTISDSTWAEGDTRYYLFGVTDDLTVQPLSWSTDISTLISSDSNALVICRAEMRLVNGRAEIIDITDLRLPFTRGSYSPNESLKYQDLLADSVFQFLRVETFENDSGITSNTTEGGTLVLDSGTSSLKVFGTSSEVSFVTVDLVEGSSISLVEQFMVAVDSTVENLEFDYSTVSATSGFTGKRYSPYDLIKAQSATATRLYLKFYIPAAEFAGQDFTSLFSYGVLLNLDNSSPNLFSLAEFGVQDLTNSITNLISNGSFYYWSKNTVAGKVADLTSRDPISFPVSESAPQLADGWQLTNINSDFSSSSVSRIKNTETSNSTALRLSTAPVPNPTNQQPTVMEYRIPQGADILGRRLTFAMDYFTSAGSALTIGIGQFQRTEAGLVLVEQDEKVLRDLTGTALVTTASTVRIDCDVISFYVKIDSTVPTTNTFWNARAAVGAFPTLPMTYVPNASSQLKSYNERGRVYLANTSQTGAVVGTSVQFASPKHLELGDLVTQTAPTAGADRSSNVSNVSYSSDRDSMVVSASASTDGIFVLQTDWEAYIKYTGGIVTE